MKQLRISVFIISAFCILPGCKKQAIVLSAHANDIFWVTNNGADMPVWVKGNTASNVVILVIHGGPGEGAYNFSDYETARLQEKYGVAFWDQRDAGAAAGNSNYNRLSLPQMIKDMEAVVKVTRFRYPAASIFVYAHSFGGLLAAGYLVQNANQDNLKGWMEIDGAHNYPLTNILSKQMLIDSGSAEISKGHNVAAWQTIVNYCQAHDPISSFLASNQIETYAHSAESLMGVQPAKQNVNILSPEDPSALLSNMYKMYYTSAGDHFIESLQNANYSGQLNKVTIPSLLLWGQYDFTVPYAVGQDALNNLGSAYKKLVLFAHSGHRPMQGDTDAVEDEIIRFVEQFK